MVEKFPFIILAGSPPERDALMEYGDSDYKSLIDINGKPMINYVLETLTEADRYTHVLIIGVPEKLVTLPDTLDKSKVSFLHLEGAVVDKIVQAGKHMIKLAEDNPSIFPTERRHAVFFSADIPAATVKVVHDFLDSCTEQDIKFYHSIVHRDIMEAEFPDSGRSWIFIRGGNAYCGGDLEMVDVYTISENYDLIKTLTENRKSFVSGLLRISPFFLIKYLLKRIKLSDAEEIMGKLFKFKCGLVVSPNPQIAFDVDKPYQLDRMREYLKNKN